MIGSDDRVKTVALACFHGQWESACRLCTSSHVLTPALLPLQTDGVRMLREEVTEIDVADIVSKWSGIPVSKLVASEREKLLHLGDVLHERVVGQDEAVDAVADAIQRCAHLFSLTFVAYLG